MLTAFVFVHDSDRAAEKLGPADQPRLGLFPQLGKGVDTIDTSCNLQKTPLGVSHA